MTKTLYDFNIVQLNTTTVILFTQYKRVSHVWNVTEVPNIHTENTWIKAMFH